MFVYKSLEKLKQIINNQHPKHFKDKTCKEVHQHNHHFNALHIGFTFIWLRWWPNWLCHCVLQLSANSV